MVCRLFKGLQNFTALLSSIGPIVDSLYHRSAIIATTNITFARLDYSIIKKQRRTTIHLAKVIVAPPQ